MMHLSRQKLIVRVFGFLLLPLFLLTCLMTCSIVNPMGLAFLTSFEVVNSTAAELWVTPIGAVGREGRRYTLPLSKSKHLYLVGGQRREFRIAPGSSLSFTYDWDDIQFSEILCRTADGSYKLLPTGLHPTERQYRRPSQTRFEVADVSALEPATDLHLGAIRGSGKAGWNPYLLAGLGLLSPFCFWLARRMPPKATKATPDPLG